MRKPRGTWGFVWKCRLCGKAVRGRTPKDGDGSVQILNKHKDQAGAPCGGRWELYDERDEYFQDNNGKPKTDEQRSAGALLAAVAAAYGVR